MASLSEDTAYRLTPQFDIAEELTTDQSCDIELALYTPLPSLSPSVSPALLSAGSSAYKPKLEPIPSQERDSTKDIVKKRKKRRVLKQSPLRLESVTSTAINRPLPPLESDSVIKG